MGAAGLFEPVWGGERESGGERGGGGEKEGGREAAPNPGGVGGRRPPFFFSTPSPPPTAPLVPPPSQLDRKLGIRTARADLPFLFRAFEAGQAPPPRPGTRAALEARAATIHEYLDWTLSAEDALEDDELDFGGFRAVVLSPRFKPAWPPPGAYERDGAPPSVRGLGAPRPPRPTLLPTGKPICAATVRSSLGYLEVPFFATQEARRNRGYGRALVECLDALARALALPTILLCSTDDPVTRGTWTSLGFARTSDAELKEFGVLPGDLLHMDNTVQMHRRVPPAPPLRSVVIKHGAFSQRCWYLPGAGPAARDAVAAAGRKRAAAAAAKPPPKKRAAVKPSGR